MPAPAESPCQGRRHWRIAAAFDRSTSQRPVQARHRSQALLLYGDQRDLGVVEVGPGGEYAQIVAVAAALRHLRKLQAPPLCRDVAAPCIQFGIEGPACRKTVGDFAKRGLHSLAVLRDRHVAGDAHAVQIGLACAPR